MVEIIQIDEHTWRIEDDFVRFFLLEGEDKAVLIDSGADCPDAAAIAGGLTDKPIILLNTHGDGDHTSGTGGFTEIYIHPVDYSEYDIKRNYPDTALVPIEDGDIIDLGKRTLKIVHIPGHTGGSVAILDISNRVLYAGDSVQKGHIYMFGKSRNVEQYESSLDKIIALKSEYDCIYASHDEFMLSADYAELVKEAWRQVRGGSVEYELVDLFGNNIKSYTTPACGFYME